mmetsp:Transcript_80252/g.192511  ORF Transcript_80252/g.192511 Transcript_80252/m.192511 type:complete len:286 (+) Transcript_80252:307-1164(+)
MVVQAFHACVVDEEEADQREPDQDEGPVHQQPEAPAAALRAAAFTFEDFLEGQDGQEEDQQAPDHIHHDLHGVVPHTRLQRPNLHHRLNQPAADEVDLQLHVDIGADVRVQQGSGDLQRVRGVVHPLHPPQLFGTNHAFDQRHVRAIAALQPGDPQESKEHLLSGLAPGHGCHLDAATGHKGPVDRIPGVVHLRAKSAGQPLRAPALRPEVFPQLLDDGAVPACDPLLPQLDARSDHLVELPHHARLQVAARHQRHEALDQPGPHLVSAADVVEANPLRNWLALQ